MIYNKKEFYGGAAMLALFFIVLYFMFQPLFNGHNSMEYLDNLYNSISKGSVEYIPALKEEATGFDATNVDMVLHYDSIIQAAQSVALFQQAGAKAALDGSNVKVSGSLGAMLKESLKDSKLMYNNDGQAIEGKYGMEPRRVLYNWWTSLVAMDKALKSSQDFAEAKLTTTIQKKAVEASYNYYEVEPVHIADRLGTVVFSLAFYVFYTLWYGFAILFLFEGWGLKLSH